MAEAAGLEPTNPFRDLVFETSAIAAMRRLLVFVKNTWCSRQESNLYQKFRKLRFYPLNYGSIDLGGILSWGGFS